MKLSERSVGAAVRESGIPRDEIWVTSKLWSSEYGEGTTMTGIDKMLERLAHSGRKHHLSEIH